MMEERKESQRKEESAVQPETRKPALASGEKVFAVVLLLTGLAAFGLTLELWSRMSEPKIASAAALHLFVSGLWVIMALLTVIENFKLETPLTGMSGMKEKLLAGLRYALPSDGVVMLGAILAYCVLLLVGISFYVATPLFLYGSMCYLTRKNYLKNILWTGVVMAFIVLVFRVLFSVIFP